MAEWIRVDEKKPPCSRDSNALGTPVLIWPRNPGHGLSDLDGHAYYGRRQTGKPEFYKYGAVIHGVTHWMPMPKGPGKD